jgi:hypothetical protein
VGRRTRPGRAVTREYNGHLATFRNRGHRAIRSRHHRSSTCRIDKASRGSRGARGRRRCNTVRRRLKLRHPGKRRVRATALEQALVGRMSEEQAPVGRTLEEWVPVGRVFEGQALVERMLEEWVPVGGMFEGQAPIGRMLEEWAPVGRVFEGQAPVERTLEEWVPVGRVFEGQAPVGRTLEEWVPVGRILEGWAPVGKMLETVLKALAQRGRIHLGGMKPSARGKAANGFVEGLALRADRTGLAEWGGTQPARARLAALPATVAIQRHGLPRRTDNRPSPMVPGRWERIVHSRSA